MDRISTASRNSVHFYTLVLAATRNELYMPEYTFEEMLKYHDDHIVKIAVFYRHEKPIGVCLVWNYPYEDTGEFIGVYVKPEYRREGIGSQLLDSVGGIKNRNWSPGEKGSGEFFLENEKCYT